MASQTALPDALSSLVTASDATTQTLPPRESLLPPKDGISLLDAKNEIFLSYLQGLALRNINVVRSLKDGSSLEDIQHLNDSITKKLVEHRVYLERGIRPLEQKIKFQADRAVKAAEDEERLLAQRAKPSEKTNGHTKKDAVNGDGDSSKEDEDESDSEDAGGPTSGPRALSFKDSSAPNAESERRAKSKEDGVYRPPRVSATTMPTTESRAKAERKPARSRAVDEYITNELSTAPHAEPSIGSTIANGGRRDKNARQLAKENERRQYEETNLVRLPKESKKEAGKIKAREREAGGFGGEEWRGLGESADRIGGLTKKRGREGVLEKSRKRETVDGGRGSGIGDAFEVKRRRVMKKGR